MKLFFLIYILGHFLSLKVHAASLADQGFTLVENRAMEITERALNAMKLYHGDFGIEQSDESRLFTSLDNIHKKLWAGLYFPKYAGTSDKQCAENPTTGAYVNSFTPNDIIFCPSTVKKLEEIVETNNLRDIDLIAEFLIHELKHNIDRTTSVPWRDIHRECAATELAASAYALSDELPGSNSYSAMTWGKKNCLSTFQRVLKLRKRLSKKFLISQIDKEKMIKVQFTNRKFLDFFIKDSGKFHNTLFYQERPEAKIMCDISANGDLTWKGNGASFQMNAKLQKITEFEQLEEPGPYAFEFKLLLESGTKLNLTCFSSTIPTLSEFNEELGAILKLY